MMSLRFIYFTAFVRLSHVLLEKEKTEILPSQQFRMGKIIMFFILNLQQGNF